jgi:hypothetical protein
MIDYSDYLKILEVLKNNFFAQFSDLVNEFPPRHLVFSPKDAIDAFKEIKKDLQKITKPKNYGGGNKTKKY